MYITEKQNRIELLLSAVLDMMTVMILLTRD